MKSEEGTSTQVERRFSANSVFLPPYLDASSAATDEAYRRLSVSVPNLIDLTHDAKAATAAEHAMSVRQALRLYPKAVCFSMILSLALVMEGYDTNLISAFSALPQFQRRYGRHLEDGSYQLTAAWQAGLSNGAIVGEIFGLFTFGALQERYGYRKTMLAALFMITIFISIVFFAKNIETLLFGEILCGIAWGAFQANACSYAAEVTPVSLRAYLTSYVNICWVFGQLIAAGVLRAVVTQEVGSEWAYRIPFAIQWVWPVPIAIGVYLAPESPWWLARHGHLEEAKESLLRLTSKNHVEFNADQTVALMVHTDKLERAISEGTTYKDCFKGTDLRRTEIVSWVWMSQVFCGVWLGGAGAYFFEQAGFSITNSFSLSLGIPAIGMIGTVTSWFLMRRVGRRTLFFYGLLAQFTLLLIIGFLAIPRTTHALSWATGGVMFVFYFCFEVSVGPVCYSLVAEIPSTRLRVKTVAFGRVCYNIASIVANILTPRMLNPSAWNLRGKAGFAWAGFCLISLTWTYFRLPEPKGLTYAELDILFEHNASARKFRKFQVILEESGYFGVIPTGPSMSQPAA